jgi:hypothetical protein
MADYAIRFSCLLNVGSAKNAARALELYNEFATQDADEETPSDGFLLSIQPEHGGSTLWIRDDGAGDAAAVVAFVRLCAAAFNLTGKWGFQYANICSRPQPDGFGGGAHALDLATGETIAWIDTDTWLDEMVSSGDPQ